MFRSGISSKLDGIKMIKVTILIITFFGRFGIFKIIDSSINTNIKDTMNLFASFLLSVDFSDGQNEMHKLCITDGNIREYKLKLNGNVYE